MEILKIIFVIFGSSFSYASTIQYFDSKIDFWDEKPSSNDSSTAPIISAEKANSKFPWKTYQDPKNKEFFKEGDYTPPEPFMEVARNPTDDNIKQWFELMKTKNEIQSRLQLRMQEYMTKNGEVNSFPAKEPQLTTPTPPKAKASNSPPDPTRFRVRMYFESTCPHCRRMFAVLKQLHDSGYEVEALQVDHGPVPSSEKVVPIGKAEPEDLKKHGIKGVPYLLIADTKRKALLPPIEGYHDFGEVMQLLRAANTD